MSRDQYTMSDHVTQHHTITWLSAHSGRSRDHVAYEVMCSWHMPWLLHRQAALAAPLMCAFICMSMCMFTFMCVAMPVTECNFQRPKPQWCRLKKAKKKKKNWCLPQINPLPVCQITSWQHCCCSSRCCWSCADASSFIFATQHLACQMRASLRRSRQYILSRMCVKLHYYWLADTRTKIIIMANKIIWLARQTKLAQKVTWPGNSAGEALAQNRWMRMRG